tara:strand:- start:972 stop:1421 length:450 start_codon:yes stop_codon:yes gene_type:complete
MPKGMTPKNRMKKTTVSLARSLKPTGRLNKDDITRASNLRSKKSLSQMKDMKKLGKLAKNIATPTASAMGMTANKLSEVMKKAKEIKPTGRISKDDLERAKKMLKISFPKKLEAKGMTPSQRRTSAKRKPASAFPPAFRERRKKGTRAK